MMLQTGPVHIHILAGAQRKELPQKLQAFMHSSCGCIWPKITCPILQDTPRYVHARIFFLQGDLHIWIGLIILQADIIARPMLLDQIALENQRLDLRARKDRFKISNLRHHRTHLGRMIFIALEILPHTILQDNCLADINDLPLCIFHNIDTRRIRQKL